MMHWIRPSALLRFGVVCFVVVVNAGVAQGGAWTAARGSFYGKLTYGASSANDQFGFDGGTKPLVEGLSDYPFADRSSYFYGEYGLTDSLTITAMVPFKRVFVHDALFNYSTTGFADVALGARYLLYNNNGWVGSVSGAASLPMPYHRDFSPPLGAGQVDLAVAANIGRSLWPLPAYATGSVGFRYRTGWYTSRVSDSASTNPFFHDNVNYANELFYTLEGGWTFFNHLLVHAVASGVISLRADGNAFTITSVPSTQQYLKLGGGAAVSVFDHYELSADVFQTLSGKNTAKSVDIFLGVGVKL